LKSREQDFLTAEDGLGQLAEAEKARAEASDSWMPIGFEQFF